MYTYIFKLYKYNKINQIVIFRLNYNFVKIINYKRLYK